MAVMFHVFDAGWLARDVERAANRVERWERERAKSARPVQVVTPDSHRIYCKLVKGLCFWANMGGGDCHCPDVNQCVIHYLDNFDRNMSQLAKAWNWTG